MRSSAKSSNGNDDRAARVSLPGQNGRQPSFNCLCRHSATSLARIITGRQFPAKQRPQQLPGPSGSSSGVYGHCEGAAMLGLTGSPNRQNQRLANHAERCPEGA